MKTKQVIISEGGETLFSPKDGVIIQGNIYVSSLNESGNPYGRLIGNNFINTDQVDSSDVKLVAYSWKELIKALNIPLSELQSYINIHTPNIKFSHR